MAPDERVKKSIAKFLLEGEISPGAKAMLGDGDPSGPVSAALAFRGGADLLDQAPKKESKSRALSEKKLKQRFYKLLSDPESLEDHTSVEKLLGGPVHEHGKAAALKVLSSGGVDGIMDALEHASHVRGGDKLIAESVEALFGGDRAERSFSGKDREKLKKIVEEGELEQSIEKKVQGSPQAFASGGTVSEDTPLEQNSSLEQNFPDQNVLMNMAKGRISAYLNSVRPLPQSRLAFDEEHEDPEKARAYDRAVDIANNPLSVLHDVRDGTVTPESVQHFNSLYPELYQHLNQKLTERVTKSQLDGERPPYSVRQGLSLFLGAPMDSTMTPASIQAVQAVFAKSRPAQQSQNQLQSPKKSTSKLDKLATGRMTPDQRRASALQKP